MCDPVCECQEVFWALVSQSKECLTFSVLPLVKCATLEVWKKKQTSIFFCLFALVFGVVKGMVQVRDPIHSIWRKIMWDFHNGMLIYIHPVVTFGEVFCALF